MIQSLATRWYGWCDSHMTKELTDRIDKLEDEVWRQHPETPGLSMRLFRIEQLLNVMLKVGGALFVCGILWRLVDLAQFLIGGNGGPPQ